MVIACGSSKDDSVSEPSDNKTTSKKLAFVGNWQMDIEGTLSKDPKVKKLAVQKRNKMRELFKKMKMSFNVSSDGTLSLKSDMDDKPKEQKATWTLLSANGNTYHIETVDLADKTKEKIKLVVTGNTMVITKKGEPLYLKK